MPTITKQTTRPVVSRITSSSSRSAWDLTAGLKVLIYGRSGTGKTTFWSSFPGPILALICSGGNRPGELRSIDTPEMRRKIDARIITSTEEYERNLEDAKNFASVVQDHASGFQDLTIKEILGLDDILLSKARIASKGESWSIVSQGQYGQSTIMCKKAFKALLTLPQHVVIVAQERDFKKEGEVSELMEGIPTVGAALTPGVAGWLHPACDYVMQAFIRPVMVESITKMGAKEIKSVRRGGGVEYCLRTEPHDLFMTKFRVVKGHKLPPVIVDPSYAKLTKIISGK